MRIDLPELSLVVLVGPSGSGKSSFARTHFKPTEILSSYSCRGLVCDDENDQAGTQDAFDVLHYIAGKRLKNGLLTVVDATNVRPEDRRNYVRLAREHHCLPTAIALNLPERVCQDRNAGRPDRDFGPHVVRNQRAALRRGMGRGGKGLRREGFRHVWILESEADVDAATVERTPLWNNKRHEHGPFDIVGDIHGCFDELVELLPSLDYGVERSADAPEGDWAVTPPVAEPARRLLFLGDLVDRGPKSPGVLRLVMRAVRDGVAHCVPGNHDVKLLRKLNGKNVQLTHGLAETMEQLEGEPPEFLDEVRAFIDGLVSHYVLDDGRLVVAHAGLKEELQGRGSGRVREFCLYGETTGETDEFGLPVRYNWAAEYRGRATVVYGHTPVPEADWLNGTICIDTGCVFGGKLTALRYPERELVSVDTKAVYAAPSRPFLPDGSSAELTAQQQHDDMLHLSDVVGKRIIDTRLQRNVTIREQNATAALEAMSRFAADPRWLIYLPPTMSPCETSDRPGCWSIRQRRSTITAAAAWRKWSAKKSTWARGRSWWRVATKTPPDNGSALRRANSASYTPGPNADSSATSTSKRRSSAACAARSMQPGCGTNSTRRGCASIASSCPGRRRRRDCSGISTPPSAARPGTLWPRPSRH